MLIKSTKTNLSNFFKARDGDIFTYKSKEYIIVGTVYDAGFMIKQCVRKDPSFNLVLVHELYNG